MSDSLLDIDFNSTLLGGLMSWSCQVINILVSLNAATILEMPCQWKLRRKKVSI